MTFAPINADLYPIIYFGDVTSAKLDTTFDFVQVNFQSMYGFLYLDGTFRNGTYLKHNYIPDGVV